MKKSIVVKATRACNLSCSYCYDRSRHRITSDRKSIIVSEVVALLAQSLPVPSQILIVLHGGEPLLIGKDEFDRVIQEMRRANSQGHTFKLAIQTNATLIDDSWADILAAAKDLLGERGIGISIDGPPEINDVVRFTKNLKGSSKSIELAIDRLHKRKIDFGLLCVVGAHNVNNPENVYAYFTGLSPGFIRFIPCFDLDESGQIAKYAITPMQYSEFLIKCYDTWLSDSNSLIPIDPFVSIIANLSGVDSPWCEYEAKSKCQGFALIDDNGGVASCDNWGERADRKEELSIFSMSKAKLYDVLSNPYKSTDIPIRIKTLMQMCSECSVYKICYGGCLATRDEFLNNNKSLSYEYCAAKKKLIKHLGRSLSWI